ncbi:MAG: APC family permease [Clostridiales bacterium]|nr:APC family permease [Clostridiales bacterium]
MSDINQEVQLKKNLSLPLLLCFGLAYLAPTVVFNYYGIWTSADGGTNGMYPLALLITTLIMTVTAYSYTRMVKAYPQAGSAYVYVNKSVQPHIGFLTGWVMLVDYLLLPMICYLLLGIYINLYVPSLPVWVIVVGCATIAAFINIVGAKTATVIDSIIIIVQVAFTLATIVLCVMYVSGGGGAGSLLDAKAFINPDVIVWADVLRAAAILCVSFVGFDAVTTMAEETKNPEKVMTPAIMGVCIGAGVMFFITSYVLNIAWPEATTQIVDPDTGIYELYPQIGQDFMADVFFVVDEFATFICAMAGMGAVSRILYSMGRDNILPKKVFGKLSRKFHTPIYNILICSVIGCSGIFYADNLIGAAELVSFGCIIGFIMVNLSVILHYYKKKGLRQGAKNKIMYLILPLIGMITLIIAFLFIGTGAKVLGGIWLAIGIIYLAVKTRGFKELPPEMTFEEE